MLGQGQATILSLNTHEALNVKSVKCVLYVAKMVSTVVSNALTTADTCTQVTITDHNIRDMCY